MTVMLLIVLNPPNSKLSDYYYLFNLGSIQYIDSIWQGRVTCTKMLSLLINIYLNMLTFLLSNICKTKKENPNG